MSKFKVRFFITRDALDSQWYPNQILLWTTLGNAEPFLQKDTGDTHSYNGSGSWHMPKPTSNYIVLPRSEHSKWGLKPGEMREVKVEDFLK